MGHTFLIRPLDRAQIFLEAVLFGVAMEWLLGDEDVWSPILEYRFKRAVSFDPTVRSRQNFQKAVFLRLVLEWLLGDEDVWSPVREYRFKWAITFDPTVGWHSNISKRCFAWGSYRMATLCRGCLIART
jgi:hypothetical protein